MIPLGSGAPANAQQGLAVLTTDESLIAVLESVVAADHPLAVVASDTALTEHLMSAAEGVAMIDSAFTSSPVAELTLRLKRQFPDLVLVVAGDARDQGALAAQITDGTVYRFLHKPVSAQRVKLFVDSALRRHDAVHPETTGTFRTLEPPPPPPSRTPLYAGIGAAASLALILGVWALQSDTDSMPPPSVGSMAAGTGAAASPGSAGSASNDATDAALDGILSRAEQAIIAENVDEADRLVGEARALRADHPRVAFLMAQIGKERERALLAAARKAAASGDYGRAIAVLGANAPGENSSQLVDAAKREFAVRDINTRVAGLLAKANDRLDSGNLLEPTQDNARFYIESARALAPADAGIRSAQRALNDALIERARTSAVSRDTPAMDGWLDAAVAAGATNDEVTSVRRELQRAEVTAKADNVTRLAQQFEQRLRQDRLLEPVGDSARSFYDSLVRTEPDHPETRAARIALSAAFVQQARGALTRGDLATARSFATQATEVGGAPSDVAALQRDVGLAQDRATQANSVVSASQLTRVRVTEPKYPADARSAGTAGFVDLEFTVKEDGTTGDVRVTRAEPAGIFDSAAVDAVERWRFQPVERNGEVVAQRARLRVRFDLQ